MSVKPKRKIVSFFMSLALLFVAFVPFQSVKADAGGVVTPLFLASQGWVCIYRYNTYAYCMNPDFSGLGPHTIMNKTFLVAGPDFSNPVYLGSSIFKENINHLDQPCPTNMFTDWVWLNDIQYYNCRHFDQPYP